MKTAGLRYDSVLSQVVADIGTSSNYQDGADFIGA